MGGWNGAVCVASRAMIITGKTIWNAKALSDQWHNQKNMEATEHSWGKLMEQKGFHLYLGHLIWLE